MEETREMSKFDETTSLLLLMLAPSRGEAETPTSRKNPEQIIRSCVAAIRQVADCSIHTLQAMVPDSMDHSVHQQVPSMR